MRFGFLLLSTLAWLVSSSAVHAASNCTFRNVGRTMQLQQACWTDATLTIPHGVTLDGRGRTITARDPQGGHFLGAVIRNAGAIAHVRNLTIDTSGLADACDSEGPPDQRLRGILFEAASGTIAGNQVRNIAQTGSGCQEGNAIEVRAGQTAQRVVVTGNRVDGYQKTGVLVTGAVDADIAFNRITGLGPVDFIAQNGIQLSFGARGRVQWNRVEGNIYTGAGAASIGILALQAGSPLEIERNRVEDNDIGIRVVSTSDAEVQWNEVVGSTFDGIAIDGLQGTAQGNLVARNRLSENSVAIDLFGAGATSNEVVGNRIVDSLQLGIQAAFGASGNVIEQNRLRLNAYGAFVVGDGNDVLDNVIADSDSVGLHVEGAGNDVQDNTVRGSGAIDIENVGANTYAGNSCTTSTGAPVDCP
jgi:hypothetical protein